LKTAASIENAGSITVDAAGSDAGSITMTATQDITLQPGSMTTASSRISGNGGDVTLQSEGIAIVSAGAAIEAKGGSESGNGGLVEIIGEHFVLAGDLDASAPSGGPGTLVIDPVNVIIAEGTNLGAVDTVYEKDIESDSQAGTNVLVEAENSITVRNMSDDQITGGTGDIHLRTTASGGSILFEDKGDSISTTEGNIIMETGGGGIDIGSLMTGRDLSGQRIRPGKITISTSNGGDIVTKNLYVNSGAGRAEVYVDASGNLTIEGDVSVGTPSEAILDIPGGSQAEALIYLTADDDVTLGGDVGAYADGTGDTTAGAITRAYITVRAGDDGTQGRNVTVMADLTALTKTSADGKSRAYIDIGATDMLYFGPDASAPFADAGHSQQVRAYDSAADSDCLHIAKIIISGCDIDALPRPESQPEPDPEPKSESKPEPDLEPKSEPKSEPEPKLELKSKPDPKPEPDTAVAASIPPAPIPDEKLGTSGCSALMKWAAGELGVEPKMMSIWMANSVASASEIQPCDTCARLKRASTVLRDYPGTRLAALTQVINEFAASDAPLSEEQDAFITAAIANNTDAGSHYAVASAYLDSLAEYVGILNSEMNFSGIDSVTLAADRYVAPLATGDNPALAGFLAARLTALGGS
jgi:hypothetical protein